MSNILRALHYLNILSIDVATGAVIGCAFIADILGVHVLPYGFITLGLTVWIIYTCDHLLDVWKRKLPASTQRHRFHQKYFNQLFVLVLLSLVMVGIQVFFIRKPVFIGGLILSSAVGLYLIFQKKLKYMKEFFAAILYSGGVLVAPLSLLQRPLSSFEFTIMTQFFLTALINLFLFSWIDHKSDALDNHPSFSIAFGDRRSRLIITFLLIVNVSLSVIQGFLFRHLAGSLLVIVAMNAILAWIFVRKNYFEINDRYRLMGDAVFLLPLIYLLI